MCSSGSVVLPVVLARGHKLKTLESEFFAYIFCLFKVLIVINILFLGIMFVSVAEISQLMTVVSQGRTPVMTSGHLKGVQDSCQPMLMVR